MKIKLFVYLGFCALALVSCKKIAPGITSTISGTVYDSNRLVAVANAKLVVAEAKYKFFYGEQYTGSVATTTSDASGKYSVTFTTKGNADQYKIILVLDTTYYDLLNFSTNIPVGKDTTVNFSAEKLFTLNAHIIVKNNPAPYVWVISVNASSAKIYGANKDTVVKLQVLPNQPNGFQFGIQVPGEPFVRYLDQPTLLSGFTDPYNQTFNIDPSTFQKNN